MGGDHTAAFRAAMEAAGVVTTATLTADGKLRRVHVEGDARGSRNGWYKLHLDGIPAGAFGHWRTGVSGKWSAGSNGGGNGRPAIEYDAGRMARELEEHKRRQDAATRARRLWEGAATADPAHPYLTKKAVGTHGVRQAGGALLVPVHDTDGTLHGLQRIATDGDKRFMKGTTVAGHFHMIGDADSVMLVVVEGYATAATVHEATELPVAIAFNAGNLKPVALALHAKYPDASIIIAGDDDRETPGNPGRTQAVAAARAVAGYTAFPTFADDEAGSDFNDLCALRGPKPVISAVVTATRPDPEATAETANDGEGDDRDGDAHGERRPLTLKRLLEGDPPPPPQMHTDQLLLAGDVNVFAGSGDAGKSTTLFAIGVATVLGRRLFGSLPVRQPGPVVLVVPEDGEAVARHHVDALVAGLSPAITDDERAVLERDLHIVGDDRPVNLLRDTPELSRLLADVRPTLVVLDPISSLIGGSDENVEQVAQAVCDNLRRDIARPFGAAVLFAGHLRKPGRDGGEVMTVNDLKGSAGWANHARVVWLVSKPKGGATVTYRLGKSNRLQTGLEHQVTLEIEANPDNAAHWLTARLTDANLGSGSQSFTPGIGRAINDNERKALKALDDRQEPGLRLSWSAWYKRSGLTSESTFRGVRERLIDAELASTIPTGKTTKTGSPEYAYFITDGGRQAIESGWKA
jgi:putative DNA primase/helicase